MPRRSPGAMTLGEFRFQNRIRPTERREPFLHQLSRSARGDPLPIQMTQFIGLDANFEVLAEMKRGFSGPISRAAMRKALVRVVKMTKDRIQSNNNIETGALRTSIGMKVLTYKNTGVTYGMVGPRRDVTHQTIKRGKRKGEKRRSIFTKGVRRRIEAKLGRLRGTLRRPPSSIVPANYAHLVEFGHVKVLWGVRTNGRVPAHHFLRPVFLATRHVVLQDMADEVRAQLTRRLLRLRRRGERLGPLSVAAMRRAGFGDAFLRRLASPVATATS